MLTRYHLECIANIALSDIALSTPLTDAIVSIVEDGESFEVWVRFDRIGGVASDVSKWLLDQGMAGMILAQIMDDWSEVVSETLAGRDEIEFARTWPSCPCHRGGMDVTVANDMAVWICRSTGKVVTAVGTLYAL